MNISSVALIYFSPTGTTKKILDAITKGLDIGNTKLINLTSPAVRNSKIPCECQEKSEPLARKKLSHLTPGKK